MYIRVHSRDNVAILVHPEGAAAGALLPDGLVARERIPQSHKIALQDSRAGEPILRYGQIIGLANRAIAAGSWVREEMLDMPAAPPLDELPLATDVPPALPPLEGYTFEGYRNADGGTGTKNILGIATTVQCVAPTVEYAVRAHTAEILPRFPNVDDVVAITHSYGCGVAIDAPGAAVPIRTLRHIGLHANLGGAPLVVSLGCEKLQPARLLRHATLPMLGRGQRDPPAGRARLRRERRRDHARRRKAPGGAEPAARGRRCPASELVVGLQCGGSDAFSGVTCNPAVGYAADLLVRAGATVMFSEVTEVRDAIHLLTPRAATAERGARSDPRDALVRRVSGARSGRSQRQYHARATSAAAWRTSWRRRWAASPRRAARAIRAVATHGEKVTAKGLVFAATPASDFICGTQQLASMNLHVFTTGEGSPYGLALVPVIKVSSRTALAEKWHDLIDLDAGRIATGDATIEDVGWDLFRLILDVASGRRKTWAEHWGLANALAPFNPGPVT